MGNISLPEQVKLFIGIIAASDNLLSNLETALETRWGKIDFKSPVIPFNFTSYYEKEMGADLLRRWISFDKLISPDQLANIKIISNGIESQFKSSDKRQVNVDPGYLTQAKVVLASTKDFSHRIYLSQGIYAEVTMIYKHNNFVFLPWTYPDYQCDTSITFLKSVRELYQAQLKKIITNIA